MTAWIAFEAVVKHSQKSGGQKPLLAFFAIPELQRILPNASQLGIEHLLHEIYDFERNEIIRNAKAELDDTQRSCAAVTLTRVILEDALDLPIDADGRIRKLLADAEAAHRTHCPLRYAK